MIHWHIPLLWRFVAATVVLLCVAVGAFTFWATRPIDLPESIVIDVAVGAGARQIALQLDSVGILRSRLAFVAMARLRGLDRRLKPGRYKFSESASINSILNDLAAGRSEIVTVTIPEGWTLAQIAEHLSVKMGFESKVFLTLADDPDLLHRLNIPTTSLEGYVLPETYSFAWGVEPTTVLATMIDHMSAIFADSVLVQMNALGMTRHDILTLASMVEAETASHPERARIAAVFHNRLRRGMLLQCDPTVIYAMGGLAPGQTLLTRDLEIDSPYNTYRHTGLPPGPIGNPGKASVLAALYPDSTDELYFVADGGGGHVFSRTLDEHNTSRARIKREQRRPAGTDD